MPFQKGQVANPNGRPKNSEAEELRVALKKAHTKRGLSILEHLVDRAYENDKVLVALAKKIVADKTEIDATIDGDLIITSVNYKDLDKRDGK